MLKKVNFEKTISFEISKGFKYADELVVSSNSAIPQWFKDIPPYSEKTFDPMILRYSTTVKRCLPMVDALTTGYLLVTAFDLAITKDIMGQTNISWAVGNNDFPYVEMEKSNRYEGFPIPEGHDSILWRLAMGVSIETPPGYSCLFTHPFNRFDLPFTSLTGVLDTDTNPLETVANLFLKTSFEGIIEKGTPIVQVTPFKRVAWNKEFKPHDEEKQQSLAWKRNAVFSKGLYRTQLWSKKSYK
jgi:hypothetical protein